jgi:hypothetical protein
MLALFVPMLFNRIKDIYQIGFFLFIEFLESVLLWGNDRIDKVSLDISGIGKSLVNERGIQCNTIELRFCERLRILVIPDELIGVPVHTLLIISNWAQVFLKLICKCFSWLRPSKNLENITNFPYLLFSLCSLFDDSNNTGNKLTELNIM